MEIERRRTDKENAKISVPIELVDIPVYQGEESTPIADISSKVSIQENTVKGKRSRKWKRVEGKKGV